MTLPRPLRLALLGLTLALALLLALVYGLAWQPAARETATVSCEAQAPTLQPGQALKVMTWNVQYLAGKRPLMQQVQATGAGAPKRLGDRAMPLEEVVRVLREEQADVVLLQELQDGASPDQLAQLQARLGELYPCRSQAFYRRAGLIADPWTLDSADQKLGTLSRYRIERAERLQLPRRPANPLQRPFNPQRALLVSYLPVRGGGQLAAINTQLDSFALADDTQQRQLTMATRLLERLQHDGTPWLLGGDFQLSPPGQRLAPAHGSRPFAARELTRLARHFPMIPSPEQASGPQQAAWYSHVPSARPLPAAGRTLDYLLHSPRLTLLDAKVRQHDTQAIADHLPLGARLLLPALD